MEKILHNDFDCFFLRLKKKLEEKEIWEEETEEQYLDIGFRIRLPKGFVLVDKEEAAKIFWSEKRPTTVFLTANKKAGISFQELYVESAKQEKVDLFEDMGRIRKIIEQNDERTVFYEEGKGGNANIVYWMEFKSFASRERVYNLIFLFETGKKYILGTFYCAFNDYDMWKPFVLKMFDTIKEK